MGLIEHCVDNFNMAASGCGMERCLIDRVGQIDVDIWVGQKEETIPLYPAADARVSGVSSQLLLFFLTFTSMLSISSSEFAMCLKPLYAAKCRVVVPAESLQLVSISLRLRSKDAMRSCPYSAAYINAVFLSPLVWGVFWGCLTNRLTIVTYPFLDARETGVSPRTVAALISRLG